MAVSIKGKKYGNKTIKILSRSKSRNLLKFKSRNLSKSKKVQNASVMKEFNFLILNTRVVFTKLE